MRNKHALWSRQATPEERRDLAKLRHVHPHVFCPACGRGFVSDENYKEHYRNEHQKKLGQ